MKTVIQLPLGSTIEATMRVTRSDDKIVIVLENPGFPKPTLVILDEKTAATLASVLASTLVTTTP